MPEESTYLGDGAYAKWREETRELVVFTTNGIFTTNSVYLDLDALPRLIKFIRERYPNA